MSESRGERASNAITMIAGIPLAIVLLIWTGWITLTAFVGGQAPFFFISFDGSSLVRGLFWLFIVDPLVLTAAYWIFMLIMLPIAGLAAGAGAIANKAHNRTDGSRSGQLAARIVTCPGCQARNRVPSEATAARCPRCQTFLA